MARTKIEIQRCALALFTKRGFEETTIVEIAEAAEVSPMTVFRYFPTKEDLVLSDDFDETLVLKIQQAPSDRNLVTRIGSALLISLAEAHEEDLQAMLARLRLAVQAPTLRARCWENNHRTQEAIVDGIGEADGSDRFQISVAAGVCLGALTIALFHWADGHGDPVALAREAFAVVGVELGEDQ